MTPLLPRLAGGDGAARAPALWNALSFPAVALIGAGIVHLLAYHIPLDVPFGPRWVAAARALLAHCPVIWPLGAAAALVAFLAALLVLRELRGLQRLNQRLGRVLAARRFAAASGHDVMPRSPWRLAVFIVVVLSLQVILLGAVDALCPMHITMVMNGAPMNMPMVPALPLAPLHLFVAIVLGLLFWLVEHRLTRLRARAAALLRLLSRVADIVAPANTSTAHLPHCWYGHALFARPPPALALC